jgi:PAS domain S-box-containing protein
VDESDRDTTSGDERYRTLLALSPDGISVVDQTGRILTCNERFAQIHGYEHSSELIGRHAAEFTSPEQYARLFREVASAFAAGQRVVRDIEVKVFRRDGATVMTEYSVAQAPWPDAPAGVAFISNIREITKWKELLAELAQHRAHLEDLVQARTRDLQAEIAERVAVQTALERSETSLLEAERMAHLGSWEIDLATSELRLSDETGRIYGFDLEARPFTLADVDNAIHSNDRSAVRDTRQRALQSDQGYNVQYRIVLPSGETRVVYVMGEIHRDATGQPTHMRGTVQDITEQERTREALDQRARELASLRTLGYEVSLSFAREDYIQIVLEKIIVAAGLDMAKLFLLR